MSSQLSGTQGLGNGGLNNHNLNPALGSSLLGGASVLGGGLGGMHSNVSAPTLGALSAQAALTHQRQSMCFHILVIWWKAGFQFMDWLCSCRNVEYDYK